MNNLKNDIIADKLTESLIDIKNEDNYILNGCSYRLLGNNLALRLMRIHNSNVIIKNLIFEGGNTELIKKFSRKDLVTKNNNVSVYELIDGGAVLITGNSSVTFKDCHFINNKSIMCGGAVSNQSIGKVTFTNCKFEDNTAGHTGAAIDNLKKGSEALVYNCEFNNNVSNSWNKNGSPHGQITLFPYTSAEIKISRFRGGSIPFDYFKNSKIKLSNNKYYHYIGWKEMEVTKRHYSPFTYLDNVKKLYWLIPKTLGYVRYKAN